MKPLGIGARLWLAIVLPWQLLFDATLAARLQRVRTLPALLPEGGEAPKGDTQATPVVEATSEPDPSPALQLLAMLQREGRFIDFLEEDVAAYSDAQIGAAARLVHAGCKRGLHDYFELTPVRSETEGARVRLEPGYDAGQTRVTGNVVGEPPFEGTLAHHGWRVAKIRLPTRAAGSRDARVVAPAEVELS